MLPDTEMHDTVILRNHARRQPACRVREPTSLLQELTGPVDTLGPARGKSMVDNVGVAERVEPVEVTGPISQFLELVNDCLVGDCAHSPRAPRCRDLTVNVARAARDSREGDVSPPVRGIAL
jgi:hypothetical protein